MDATCMMKDALAREEEKRREEEKERNLLKDG